MIYLLVILLAGLLAVAIHTTKGDIFAPEVMICIAFLFGALSALYQLHIWQFELSVETVLVVTGAVAISIIVGIFVRARLKVPEAASGDVKHHQEININPIPLWGVIASLLFIIFTALSTLMQVQRIASSAGGGGDFASMMATFRTLNSFGTDPANQLSGWVLQFQKLSVVLGYLFIFNFLFFLKKLKLYERILNVVVIVLSVMPGLLTGGRFRAMALIIGGLLMFWIIWHQRKKGKNAFTLVLKMVGVVCIALILFYVIKGLVGRVSDYDLLTYVTHYAGGPIVGLDLYFKNPPEPSSILGKYTFYSLNNGLRKLGLLNFPYYIFHHPFQSSNGVGIGNVYTALMDYHYDFGMVGMIILHVIFCLFFSWFYETTKRQNSAKKGSPQFRLIVLSMIYYCVPMYAYNNEFYSMVISFGFLVQLIEAFILFEIFFDRYQLKRRLHIGISQIQNARHVDSTKVKHRR